MKSQKFFIVTLILFLVFLLLVGSFYFAQLKQNEPDIMACTMDALVCPDGSAVGRTGPSCAFAPCVTPKELVGEFIRDEQGARMIVPSPEGIGVGVTYVVPLIFSENTFEEISSGRMIRVTGKYTEGNVFLIEQLSELSNQNSSTTGNEMGGILRVGENVLLKGVRVTLHEVLSDSRCPEGVTCVWAGEVSLRVTLQSDTDKETLTLSSASAPHPFDAYQVKIKNITPNKQNEKEIAVRDYQIEFTVSPL